MKKTRLLSFLAALPLVICTSADAALVARYQFATGSTLVDSSGNGYGLTQNGTVNFSTASVAGVTMGTANATNVAANANNRLSRTAGGFGATDMEAMTVTVWLNPTSTANLYDDALTARGGTQNWNLQSVSTTPSFSVHQYSIGTTDAGEPLTGASTTFGNWAHFAIRQSGGTLSLFLNGALIDSDTTSITNTLDSLYLFGGGNTSSGSVRGWTGSIADVQVYNEALPNAAIAYQFANPGSVVPEPTASLLGGLGMLTLLRRRR